MKSIVEEASSIVKAIEKAWERAERPQEFTIKIFEDVQRGFLGMTKKQAKVGIFFEESVPHADHSRDMIREKMIHMSEPEKDRVREREPKPRVTQHPVSEKRKKPAPIKSNGMAPKERRSPWSDDMKHAVEAWLSNLIEKSELPSIHFISKSIGNRLHITFEKPLFDMQEKNIALFRSLSYLLLGMLRSKFKKEFRFLKIVLTAE